MGTHSQHRPHARYRDEHNLWWLGLTLMAVSAVITVVVIYFGLVALLSLHEYIESVPLR